MNEYEDAIDAARDGAEQAVLDAFQRMWPDFAWDGCYDLADLLHHAEGQLYQEREDAAAPSQAGDLEMYLLAVEESQRTIDRARVVQQEGQT